MADKTAEECVFIMAVSSMSTEKKLDCSAYKILTNGGHILLDLVVTV